MSGPSSNRVQVQKYRVSNQPYTVDLAATDGAVIGTNLWDSEGNLITQAQWNALLSGTSASPSVNLANATTDDLDEGEYNLYFTNLRAQNAVGSILKNTGSIIFTYTTGASITAQADLFYLMATR
jgi:hypothetical protein